MSAASSSSSSSSSVLIAAVLLLVLVVVTPCTAFNVLSFGAQANNETYEASIQNGKALYLAFQAANNAANASDRTVVVPPGIFTFIPFAIVDGVRDISFSLEGVINVWPGDTALWTNRSSDGRAMAVITIDRSSGIVLTGGGRIEGNGYRWWWAVILGVKDNRPHLLEMESCSNVIFERWTLRNSPMYHVKYVDMVNVEIRDITVRVDVDEQKQLLAKHGHLTGWGLPTFPLNTDGIDVRGRNITIRSCSVENFDDALCVKPMDGGGNQTQCSEGIVIEDSNITWGVGATIGSEGPNPSIPCIRNVVFRRIHFQHPLKGIYVKPNPGNSGSGIIDNITYEDIVAETPLWWAIWVSTQQQLQPGGGANTHCSFFYPILNTTCPLQPLVPVTNLNLRNVVMNNPLLSPGVLRCSDEGPCHGWVWNKVSMPSVFNWPMGTHFLCHGLQNMSWTNVGPTCTDKPDESYLEYPSKGRHGPLSLSATPHMDELERAHFMYAMYDV